MSKVSENLYARVQSADPDRLRAAQLADKHGRERLLILYAFHLELAKVPELVSEPMIGDIRYQWWRDAIDEIYGDSPVRAHEVSTPLADVVKATDIPRYWMDQLIDGRNRDLDPTPFAGIEVAAEYCRKTSGVLMQIAAKCLKSEFDDKTLGDIGEVWGLTGLARAYGYYHDSMLANVGFETLLGAIETKYKATKTVKVPSELLPAYAYVGLVPKFLIKMRAGGYDPKVEAVSLSPFSKQLTQFGMTLRGGL